LEGGFKLKIETTVQSSHGVLFLCENNGDEIIPEDTSASQFTFTENCVAFLVAPEADSSVVLRVIESESETTLKKEFSHTLKIHDNTISVSHPDGDVIFSIPVRTKNPLALFYVDKELRHIDILI
jgi:hypothetical protein